MARLQWLESQSPTSSSSTSNRPWPRRQRKVHHKVKTGCRECKLRRRKCDERKPVCSGCSKYSTDCLYEFQKPSRREKPAATFSVPSSPSECLSPAPSSELNLADLELLHQFLTSTCMATAQLPEVTAHIQLTVPRLAQAYPFVMRGILARAATHLSRLRPSRRAHYAILAARNHEKALPDFRSALQNINEENCHALIFFSKGLLWCSLASDEYQESDHTKIIPSAENKWLPQWFHLLRGSCRIVESSRIWLKHGPHLLHSLDSTANYSNSPDDRQISTLITHLPSATESDSRSLETILSSLRESFARASMRHHNTPYRNAINFWITSLPDEYIDLLQQREPWALVLLAHFCVLLHRSETVWFMRGHAVHLMRLINERLDPAWKRYVRWPCKELGVEQDFG